MNSFENNKKIYIVLTYTGTFLSKIIKFYTKEKYSHVSLSLDKELKEMYSFGRLNPYNPFIGGFVHEGINKGTFKRFKKTKAEIYELSLTNDQYKVLKDVIERFENNKEKYKFNLIGLFLVTFNKKYRRFNAFYCAEFVKYLINKVYTDIELPEIVKPMDFKNIDNLELKYQGILRNYSC